MRKEFYEANLIQDLAMGSEAALLQFYQLYADRIFDVSFYLLKDTGWSEDIVQEVFVKLWTNRMSIKQDVDLWPFLYVLAKRECFNKLRSIKRSHAAFELLAYHIEGQSETADRMVERKELSEEIEGYLSQLPAQQKLIFTLSRVDGVPCQQIAEELNLSKNTVKNHLARASKSLKQVRSGRNLLLSLFFYFY
ncbi:sigma-70 family RNA polymerase sigma factor [Sphingobacterium sp. ML3W]|uniref:RNA polymerase sigma factor n=1 Tax=Sphingobacterium sp. ML3W TaxID=1538644 RepID=UPI00249A2D78|nr:sigma-70 family RNA polymerase sigma factor [Sphingobacterium sp. ML3W]WFA78478.1 sigma-70 family RNA polymerase sigma factor [Sphingobacterium sp. ML3W]